MDTISRQAAIEAIMADKIESNALNIIIALGDGKQAETLNEACDRHAQLLKDLPSAQPERLTDDDFETIRIHLNAYKEKLCNQQRWEEAGEYQRILDRFMAFATAQPEIIRCKDCRHVRTDATCCLVCNREGMGLKPYHVYHDDFCSYAERREE